MLITRKIEILPNHQDGWDFMRELNHQVWMAANRIVSEQFWNDNAMRRIAQSNPDISNEEKAGLYRAVFGASSRNPEKAQSVKNTTYQLIRKEFPDIPSTVATSLNSQIYSLYRSEKKEVNRGERSIRSFRRNQPIPFQKTTFTNFTEEGFTWCKHDFSLRYGRDRSGNRLIVQRILAGEYEMKDSSFQFLKKKLFLNLVVDIPAQEKELDPDIIVGVDLGLKFPAYAAVLNGPQRKAIGSVEDFLNVRLRIQNQRRLLQRNLKFTQGGKGRKKKLKRLETLTKRERNFIKTMNHRISREVVDFAVSAKAGTIAMEDLSGFGGDPKKDFFLRNWSYYELQQYIEYKAQTAGINVLKVDPAYTSLICAECGAQNEGDYDPHSATFICSNHECTAHNKKVHGDYNAALNIAARLIEKL